MTPLLAVGSLARRRAAAGRDSAEEAEVRVIMVVPSPVARVNDVRAGRGEERVGP